jgi:serine/threonine protein kinase
LDYSGKQIGKYKIIRLIGEGGMATVYEAEHKSLGTKAAVKVLNPVLSANEQIHQRFKNEARLMASLNHPNITKVIDYEETDDTLAIIMEYLEGNDLNEVIRNNGRMSDDKCNKIFSQVLSAFSYAHEQGVVHRDIKPSNIYILKNGIVKILDFGIAKILGKDNEMTQTGTQIGTPIYMSPEQVKSDKSIDHRSDIYSLGVTMFFMLNGTPPYDGNTLSQFDIQTKVVNEPLPALSKNSSLQSLIERACKKNRNDRFQNCTEWEEALRNYKSATTVPTEDKTIIESPAGEKTVLEPSTTTKTVVESPVMERTVVEKKDNKDSYQQRNIQGAKSSNNKKRIIPMIMIGVIAIVVTVIMLMPEDGNSSNRNRDEENEESRESFDAESAEAAEENSLTSNWASSNLRNGSGLRLASDEQDWIYYLDKNIPAYAYPDFNRANENMGYLYNHAAVRDLVSRGAKLVSKSEWQMAYKELGLYLLCKRVNMSLGGHITAIGKSRGFGERAYIWTSDDFSDDGKKYVTDIVKIDYEKRTVTFDPYDTKDGMFIRLKRN